MDEQDIIKRIQRLIVKVNDLPSNFWTNEELQILQQSVDFLELRIQSMMKATVSNFNWYQQKGWKLLNDEEGDQNK